MLMNHKLFGQRSSLPQRAGLLAIMLVLAGCASSSDSSGQGGQAQSQAVITEEQRAAEVAAVLRAAEERSRLEAERAEGEAARQAAERQAQDEARARAEREQLARAEAAEQQRRADESRQREQQARIAELEAEIAAARVQTENVTATNGKLEEAIATAEELLDVLAAEQLKYGTADAAGQLAEPLQKDLIADLESVKNTLKREAQALVQ